MLRPYMYLFIIINRSQIISHRNSNVFISEFPEDHEKIVPLYYMHSNMSDVNFKIYYIVLLVSKTAHGRKVMLLTQSFNILGSLKKYIMDVACIIFHL